MKKLILTILIALFIINVTAPSVAQAATPTNESTRIITNVYYDSSSGHYIAETDRDSSGGFWVIDVLSIGVKKENKYLTKQLKRQYIGKTVHIIYSGDEQNDEEIEILDTWIEA